MAKLSLTASLATYQCIDLNETTAIILGANAGAALQSLLADEKEFETLKENVRKLREDQSSVLFGTFNLVFVAPNPPAGADRSPYVINVWLGPHFLTAPISHGMLFIYFRPLSVEGVFRSPIRAIHW